MYAKNATLHEQIDLLQDEDQEAIHHIVEKLVLVWDNDYTKVTPKEAESIEQGKEDFRNNDYMSLKDYKKIRK